jgi:hypothetical protein
VKQAFTRSAFALATVAGLLFASAVPAAATPAIPNYPTKQIKNTLGVYGSAHIQWISGTIWDIAVNDQYADGRNVCVRIAPVDHDYIYYCDDNGSANAAKHYRITYPWFAARGCAGSNGTFPAFCIPYIDYHDPYGD